MAEKFFGQFLLERGALRREGLLDALAHQAAISIPLCALALDRGLLTDRQIEDLDAERKRSSRKVLEMAIRGRMLSFRKLEEAAQVPAERRLFLAEVLIQRGWLTLVQAHRFLAEHRRECPSQAADLDTLFQHMDQKDVIIPFVRTTVDLFLQYAKQVLKVVSVADAGVDTQRLSYAFSQKVKGDREFYYVLVLPEELVYPVASHILQIDGETMKVSILDAVLEFANIVVGNACSELSAKGLHLTGEPPQLLMLDAISAELPDAGVTVNVQAAKGAFQILLRFCKRSTAVAEE